MGVNMVIKVYKRLVVLFLSCHMQWQLGRKAALMHRCLRVIGQFGQLRAECKM